MNRKHPDATTGAMASPLARDALREPVQGDGFDAADAVLSRDDWLLPPDGFSARVRQQLEARPSAALRGPPVSAMRRSTNKTWRDRLTWLTVLVAGAAGLGEVLSFVSSLWLATTALG